MFFVLSKLLYPITSPLYWILALLIWQYFAKKPRFKKCLRITTVVILLFFTNEYLLSVIAGPFQPKPTVFNNSTQYECGILLGGMSRFDKNDAGFFSETSDRFTQTVKLYHQRRIKKILVTGGSGHLLKKEKPEALFIETELLSCGVNREDIIVESRSKNTHENAVFSKQILDSLHIQGPYVLITSASHMPRSMKVFTHTGFFGVIPYPCNYIVVNEKKNAGSLFVPKIEVMYKWQVFIKEWAGIAMYALTDKL